MRSRRPWTAAAGRRRGRTGCSWRPGRRRARQASAGRRDQAGRSGATGAATRRRPPPRRRSAATRRRARRDGRTGGGLRLIPGIARDVPEVTECYRITGEDCYFMKVHLRSIEDLEPILDLFTPHGRTTTSIVNSAPVPPRPLPVG
ncbi:MAG: Lrp/AsnC ligand binding domain-containing protein [Streptosporangiaceae bacterium]|nr:Lrp/AsnC ligand binding domain-containing protein [Streptosporangiaceae bacterium]